MTSVIKRFVVVSTVVALTISFLALRYVVSLTEKE